MFAFSIGWFRRTARAVDKQITGFGRCYILDAYLMYSWLPIWMGESVFRTIMDNWKHRLELVGKLIHMDNHLTLIYNSYRLMVDQI